MYDHAVYYICLQIAQSDIRTQGKTAVNLLIADDYF